VVPDLPPPVVGIIRRALAKAPSERYANAGEMLAAIEECTFSLALRGSAQALSDSLQEVFAHEYAAETEHIRKIVEMGRKTDDGPDVSNGKTGTIEADIQHISDRNIVDQAFSETISISRTATTADDSTTAVQPVGGRTAAILKRILPNAWTKPQIGIAAGCLVVSTLLFVWAIASRAPADSPEVSQPEKYSVSSLARQRPATAPLKPENPSAGDPEKRAPVHTNKATKELLDKAEERMKAYRLTTPEADSAYAYFQKVLLMDADNAEAKMGMRRIGDAYGRLADNALEKFKYDRARVYVDRGLAVVSDHPYLLELKKTLARNRPSLLFESVRRKVGNTFGKSR